MKVVQREGKKIEIEEQAGFFTARYQGRPARVFSRVSAQEACFRLSKFDSIYRSQRGHVYRREAA